MLSNDEKQLSQKEIEAFQMGLTLNIGRDPESKLAYSFTLFKRAERFEAKVQEGLKCKR